MKEPKVSVIIPIYNTGKYLPECVESVRNQTLKEIEIILVDDESPDNAPQLCDQYAEQDERIKVVHKKNGGLGYARNSGLDVATGEFVSFIDSDDFIAPDMMQTLYDVAKRYDADEVRSGTIFYNNGKKTIRRDVEQTTVYKGKDEVRSFVFDLLAPLPEEARDVKYMMSVCLALHSRKVIEDNKVRFTSERQTLSEDLIFDLDLFPKMNCIVCIPECFYHYRMNSTSLSHTYSIEKYKRNHQFLQIVREKLNDRYSFEDYGIHYLRLQFLYLRNSISHILHTKDNCSTKYRHVRYVLHDNLWKDMLKTYPYNRMDFKHKLYFILLKNRLTFWVMIINRYFL